MFDLCPVCESGKIREFFHIPEVPIHCNRLWDTRQEALSAPCGEIRLGVCEECGHIFNLAFDPSLVEYDSEYENSLFFSPRFQEYAKGLAASLVESYDLHEKSIVEIGSGRGDFLRLLCELGDNQGVGFDPSFAPDENFQRDERIQFIADFFSEKYLGLDADLLCCRHVLEHLASPGELIRLARMLNCAVFFEVPNAFYTLRDLGIWDIIYEHPSFFCPQSLAYLFRLYGFSVERLAEAFGNQFLALEALPNDDPQFIPPRKAVEELLDRVEEFSGKYRQKIIAWEQVLHQIKETAQKTVLWGAGSKGVTFLNICSSQDVIPYVIDINPHKLAKYIPRSGQQIFSPEFLTEYQPDVIILMNAIYEPEIRQQVELLGFHAQFLIA